MAAAGAAKRIDGWSLTSLQQRLVKTGGRLIPCTRVRDRKGRQHPRFVISRPQFGPQFHLPSSTIQRAAQLVTHAPLGQVQRGGLNSKVYNLSA